MTTLLLLAFSAVIDPMPELAGDVNSNGIVDFPDFVIVSNNFNQPGGFTREQGDLTGDFSVNFEDFVVLSNAFGNTSERPELTLPDQFAGKYEFVYAANFPADHTNGPSSVPS